MWGCCRNLLKIDLDKIYAALDFHFKGKTKPIDLNFGVVKAAYNWAAENLVKTDRFLDRADERNDRIALWPMGIPPLHLAAIYGGVQFVGWYPITPASSLPEALIEYLPKLRKDPETGQKHLCRRAG